jgi:hypothetical protein
MSLVAVWTHSFAVGNSSSHSLGQVGFVKSTHKGSLSFVFGAVGSPTLGAVESISLVLWSSLLETPAPDVMVMPLAF